MKRTHNSSKSDRNKKLKAENYSVGANSSPLQSPSPIIGIIRYSNKDAELKDRCPR